MIIDDRWSMIYYLSHTSAMQQFSSSCWVLGHISPKHYISCSTREGNARADPRKCFASHKNGAWYLYIRIQYLANWFGARNTNNWADQNVGVYTAYESNRAVNIPQKHDIWLTFNMIRGRAGIAPYGREIKRERNHGLALGISDTFQHHQYAS